MADDRYKECDLCRRNHARVTGDIKAVDVWGAFCLRCLWTVERSTQALIKKAVGSPPVRSRVERG